MVNFILSLRYFLLMASVRAIYIPPEMKDYVRYTDDGLYRGTINAFENEWKRTFIDGVNYCNFLKVYIH